MFFVRENLVVIIIAVAMWTAATSRSHDAVGACGKGRGPVGTGWAGDGGNR